LLLNVPRPSIVMTIRIPMAAPGQWGISSMLLNMKSLHDYTSK
jgi:hypothetical protein